MLIVFGSRRDEGAQSLTRRWARHDARMLTSDDLSAIGWRHGTGAADGASAVVSGVPVPVGEISAVLIRWPRILPQELTQIMPGDREYVASEMTAFLVYWFSQLRCRVVNRPTPASLLGPGWSQVKWIHTAAQLGIPVRPVRRCIAAMSREPIEPLARTMTAPVTVVAGECLGVVHRVLFCHARRLADAAGVDLMEAHFAGPDGDAQLLGVNPAPSLAGDAVADAVLAHLLSPASRGSGLTHT